MASQVILQLLAGALHDRPHLLEEGAQDGTNGVGDLVFLKPARPFLCRKWDGQKSRP